MKLGVQDAWDKASAMNGAAMTGGPTAIGDRSWEMVQRDADGHWRLVVIHVVEDHEAQDSGAHLGERFDPRLIDGVRVLPTRLEVDSATPWALKRDDLMKTYDKTRVMAVGCPHCGAEADRRCQTTTGKLISNPHTLRKGVVYPRFMEGAKKNQLRNRKKA